MIKEMPGNDVFRTTGSEKETLARKASVMSENPNKMLSRQVSSIPAAEIESPPPSPSIPINQDVFDRSLVLLLEREETLLGDIIAQCRELIQSTELQVREVADFLDDEM